MPKVTLLVEGYGDVAATPLLARRALAEQQIHDVQFVTQRRNGIDSLKADNWANLRRYLQAAALEGAPILLAIDCDDGCAWQAACEFNQVAAAEGLQVPFGVSFWVREFECMFLHDFGTLIDAMRLTPGATAPNNPDNIRGAKGWIDRCLPRGRIYKERLDQPRLAALVDLNLVHERYRSYRHFLSVLQWLLAQNGPGIYPIPPPPADGA